MGRKSSITADPAIRTAVDGAIHRGCTIDAIKQMLDKMGAEISRSAVGRHASKYKELAERQRDIRAAADAFATEFGGADDNQTRLMIQMVTTLITENVLKLGDGTVSAMDINFLASASKSAIGAAKIDDERKRALRKEAFIEAASAAVTAAKRAGASPETINLIRAKIMGIEL